MASLRYLFPILLGPGTVTVAVPAWLLYTQPHHFGWGLRAPFSFVPVLAGLALIGAGLFLLISTISMFAFVGQGTLAPWDPPQRLVVRGIYRHVRNPMIAGAMLVLLSEAVMFGSVAIAGWLFVLALINAIYIPNVEEAGLAERFGADYQHYVANVPRWIPRRQAWEQESLGAAR